MAKFDVYGKRVFVNDELVKLFEEMDGNVIPFDNSTAKYIVEISDHAKEAEELSSMELTKLIEKGIRERAEAMKEIFEKLPEIEEMAFKIA